MNNVCCPAGFEIILENTHEPPPSRPARNEIADFGKS